MESNLKVCLHGCKAQGLLYLRQPGLEDAARHLRIKSRNTALEMMDNIGELDALYKGPSSFKEAQDIGNIGAYALWGINETLKQVPNLAVMALGSIASGGLVAPALLGRFALTRALSKMPFAASTQQGAAIAGVGLTSALLNTGEIYSGALLETGETNPGITGLAGLVAGSLDLWPGSKVIRAMGKGPDLGSYIANKFISDKGWKKRLYRALELGATEAVVERCANCYRSLNC